MKSKRIFLMSVLLIATTAMGANAQSQDRDNPTPFVSNPAKGNGTGKKVEYFYSFTGGPGEVAITVDLKAKAGSTNADIEVFDGEGSKIFYYYPNATSQNEHAVKRFTLNNKQLLILRVALDSSAGEYSIKLGGAVELAAPAAATDAVTATDSVTATAAQPDASAAEADTSAAQPDISATQPVTEVAKPGKKINLDFNLKDKLNLLKDIPTSGSMVILMKDGSTQEIQMKNVKSITMKP
jgi:hypothetical protein